MSTRVSKRVGAYRGSTGASHNTERGDAKRVTVSIADQVLVMYEADEEVGRFTVSTGKRGVGEKSGSGQTPRGVHRVRAKIGGSAPMNAVFVGRRLTGEIYSEALAEQCPERDWILTRILWLCGCEVGKNRLGDCDSMRRYIYIHGTPDSEPMGVAESHGCIRMRNDQVIELFDWLPYNSLIDIVESGL